MEEQQEHDLSLFQLPSEIWLQIFSFSNPQHVLRNLALVCQHFHSLSKDEMLWKVFCSHIGISQQKGSFNWQQTFKVKCGRHQPPHVVWAVLGHVDCGKSTLCGRMLLDTGAVTMTETSLANLVDRTKAERERGITICEHILFCERTGHTVALIDTPGHRDFIKTTYTSATMADYALFVVSALPGEYEGGFAANGQTREHMLLAFVMGLSKLVVAVNKFDKLQPSEAKNRFESIMQEILVYSKKVGFKEENITFVPFSGLTGDNLFPDDESSSSIKEWHNGPTLWEVLTSQPEPERNLAGPLRMTILHHFFKWKNDQVILGGRILTGVLRVGDEITLIPNFKGLDDHDKFTVLSIEKNHQPLKRGIPGDIVGVKIQLEGKKLEFQRKKHHGGSILTHYAPSPLPSTDHQLVKLDSMLCHIIKLGPASVIKANTCGIMVIHTARIRIRIISLLQKQDRRTGLCLEEYPRSITTGEAALALIRPDYLAWPEKLKYDCQFLRRKRRPSVLLNDGYCVDTFSHFPMMGRFVIYLQRGDSLVGVVKEINPKRE